MAAQNKINMYRIVALLVGLSLLLGACSSPTPAPTEAIAVATPIPTEAPVLIEEISQEDLVGSTWQWVGGRETASAPPFVVPDPENYTLSFNEDGTLFTQADCNTSRGTYELSGDQLSITMGATTLMACEPDSLSDQFLAQLAQASRAGAAYGNLVIVLADEAGEMYFQRATLPTLGADLEPISQEELVDTLWQWTNLVERRPRPRRVWEIRRTMTWSSE